VVNGTQTMFVGNPTIGAYPIGFEIGTDYLKGTKYYGVDKKLHPVTVDAAVVHELTHIAYNTSDEEIPILVEGIVTSALGAVKRQEDAHNIVYSKGSNGGFWLLSRNIKDGGRLGDEFADRVRSDFSAIEDSSYDFTKAFAAFEFTPVK